MDPKIDESLLLRRWVHAHEEDAEGTVVYRPAEYPLPPSRGRTGFELRPDGTALRLAPGPTDRPEQHAGTWSRSDEGALELRIGEGASVRRLQIEALGHDRMVVRPEP